MSSEAVNGAAAVVLEWNDVGYVALSIGAGALGFDYFSGSSSPCTRFVTTELALRNARLRFRTDWLVRVSQSGGFKAGELKPFVDRLNEFVSLLLKLVERETQEWVAEFRSSLAEFGKLGNRTPHAATKVDTSAVEEPPSGRPNNGGARTPGSQAAANEVITPRWAAGGGAQKTT